MNTLVVSWLSLLTLTSVAGQRLGNECGRDGTKAFLSMVDCTSFVRCETGKTVLTRCPPTTYFNQRSEQCDLHTYEECMEAKRPHRQRLLPRPSLISRQRSDQIPDSEEIAAFVIEDNALRHGHRTSSSSSSLSPHSSKQTKSGMMVCYYSNWAQYRSGFAKYTPEDIRPGLCDRLHYAFAKINSDHTIAAYEWNDESTDWMVGMYEKFNNLKKNHPGLKTVLSVGGWNLASGPFTAMAATRETRKTFIDSVVAFLRKWNFDGLGIDWEYPGSRGSPAGDKEKFTLLVQELMAAFQAEHTTSTGRDRLTLSAAVSAGKATIDQAYEVDKISSVLDYIVVMTYDFFGAWNDYTGLVSPLYAPYGATGIDAIFNVDYAAKYWLSKGCPKEKLVIGVISYGRSFTLTNVSDTGLKAPANGPGTPGRYTGEAGFLSYYEVCEMIKKGGKIVQLVDEKVPYLVLNNQWVTYEDKTSLATKAQYIQEGGFAGAAMWALPLDDFKGDQCGEGPYPLLSTVSRILKDGGGHD